MRLARISTRQLVFLSPGNAALEKASRNVKAVYAELLVPIIKDLEMQLALRRDDYSLVGASTNPKVSFRYQPASWLLFRGSASKGFLAPSFTQLYSGQLFQELSSGVIDTHRLWPPSRRSGVSAHRHA